MDKNKIIEAAAKLVAKGAYDKAIKEYQRVLDADPKDVRILQKMGELYQKKNEPAQAAQYFNRVAESYTSDGFFLKAVALYKQVLKLDPSLVDVNLRLAELHQQLQLIGESMGYYQLVANHFDKQGDTRRSLEVLRKLVDLDPDNVSSRSKLADLYLREGLQAEAIAEFSKAAEQYKRTGRSDDHLRVAERLSTLQPDNFALAKELAEIYLQKNDQKRALAKLQICFKADNRDIETLKLLAVAFQGLGQMSKTVSVYKELARAYENKRFPDEAAQVWRQVAQLDPTDADALAHTRPAAPAAPAVTVHKAIEAPVREAVPDEALTADPQMTQPVLAIPAVAKPRADVGKLLTETDVYVKYGLHDKALEHLRKVFAIDPEFIDAHEKAYAIYVASNNVPQAFEQLLNVLRLHTRSGDAQRAQPYLAAVMQQNPNHPEVPTFLSVLQLEGSTLEAPEALGADPEEDAILVDSSDEEVIVAEEPEEVISAQLEEEFDSEEMVLTDADAAAVEEFMVEPPPVPEHSDTGEQPLVAEFDAEAENSEISYDSEIFDAPDDGPSTATGEFGLVDDVELNAAHRGVAQPLVTEDALSPVGLGEEFDSLPTSIGRGPSVQPFSAAAASNFSTEAQEWPTTAASDVPAEAYDEELVTAPPVEEPAGEEVDEAMFFVEQALYEEAREILETVMIAYPGHERAAALLARVDAEQNAAATSENTGSPAAESGRDAFDLAAELANELGDFGEEHDAESSAPAGNEYQVSVEEVFSEFKKGVEKVVKPEDVDTHYDLGVAYKEMGLLDDAIGEFSIARKGCLGKRKEIDCLSMIGMLQLSRNETAAAIDAYHQALTSEYATGEVEKSLRYELATALEVAHQAGRALGHYLKVKAVDSSYREVASHVARLSATVTPEDDDEAQVPKTQIGKPGGGGRKVGYV